MDYATELRLIRANLGENPADESTHLIDDDTLKIWLDERDGSSNWATHKALLTIAMSEALLSKKITTQDLSTDGPAVAASLMKLADYYKAQADTEAGETYFAAYVADEVGRRREAEERRVYGGIEWF
ncbi:hypothetical protein [Citricoccus sp. NR2]|uniref:hypothetical protein n=1 Tax=Citricoccus sp. NR2 TaxID=3004095 RepID=UPI0022DD23B5|nr:hypothetical protein [Citricoccus sp. NR2]WBL18514.1 hypothetical protein O1A05_12205 [Citricoccus sp. NR2]